MSHKSSTISIPIGGRSDALELTDISQTPGGTIYGTTPGGTRRVYQRNVLMTIRNSPHAKTPPVNLPNIPGVTKGSTEVKVKKVKSNEPSGNADHDDIFQME